MKKLVLLLLFMFLSTSAFAVGVQLSWDPNTEADLAGYKVYQSTTSGGYVKGSPIAAVASPTVTYTVASIVDGTYYYVLTAFDTSGNESDFSNEVSIKIDTVAPGKTVGLTAVVTANTVKLTWTASTDIDTVGYKIYQYTTSGSPGTAIATIGKVTSWTSAALADGTYYFTVSAVDDGGNEGVTATEVLAKIDTTAPSKPKNVKVIKK
jgi:fibronectin type 3 domain-containing protein